MVIYFTAPPPPANPLGYDPLQSKRYVHDLEVFGGQANVLLQEFQDWFEGLWHGRNLAFTVAVLTIVTAVAVRLFALTAHHAVAADEKGPELPKPPPT